MEVSLVAHSFLILFAFSGINLYQAFEESNRTYPDLKGLDEGKNPRVNFMDALIFIEIIVLEFQNLPWWGAILHFTAFYLITPFFVSLIAKLMGQLLFVISLTLKIIVIVVCALEIFGGIDLI